jgi:uncharacterized protein (TIGR02246 family)
LLPSRENIPSQPGGYFLSHFRFSLFIFAVLAILAACNTASQPSSAPAALPDTRAADEAAIRALDTDWVKAIASKNLAQATSYYADTAEMYAPNASAASGKDSVQKLCAGMLGLPGFALTFAPSKVQVARSGDLAYETGEYEMTLNDKKGTPHTVKAKYVVVWGKQSDGNWKALVDAPTTTTP